jgi:hypothetical protein
MDKDALIYQLCSWFKPWEAENIYSIIMSHKTGTRTQKESATSKALKTIRSLQKQLASIEKNYPAAYDKIDVNIRLQRLSEHGFISNYDESLSTNLKLIETSVDLHLNSYQDSPTPNSRERLSDGEQRYSYTNNSVKNYHLIKELEAIWKTGPERPIIKADYSEFAAYLSLCLFGHEGQTAAARKAYRSFRTEAESWGTKRTKMSKISSRE